MVKTLLLSLLLPMVLLCQTQEMDNGGVPNGRFWRLMSKNEKNLYMLGLKDGFTLAGMMAEVKNPGVYSTILGMMPANFSVLDYETELDLFYKDTENVLINLKMAWTYCNTKLKGTSTREALETELIRLRQDAAMNYAPK